MAENPQAAPQDGVAVWLDDLARDPIRSRNLQSLVDDHLGAAQARLCKPSCPAGVRGLPHPAGGRGGV